MSGYERKELQILGGAQGYGLNLDPPTDKVPIGQQLLLQNFRVDRDGQLISRYGYPIKGTIAGGGIGISMGVYGGVEGPEYVATYNPNNLYRYFDATHPPIATGFDGNRVAFMPMNGWMYVMNRAVQGRHNDTDGWQQWGITPPQTSCVAAAGSAGVPQGSVTYTYALTGQRLYIHYVVVAGRVYSLPEADYTLPGLLTALANISALDKNCSITYDGGSTLVITPVLAGPIITVSGSDGNPTVLLQTGATTDLPNGTYQYYVTYSTADQDLESNPSPASNSIVLATEAAVLTNIPVSPDPRVVRRNIYATGGTLGQAYLVGALDDNVTTTFTVAISDDTILRNGVTMPVDHDGPPACSGMTGPYYSRALAWSTLQNPNRLFWTDVALPQYWPGATNPNSGNWVDVGMDGEAIIWCTQHTNVLVIYKEKSIWRLIGDPDTGQLEQVSSGPGLVSAFALADAGLNDYYVAPNGLYRFDLDRAHDMTAQIRPLFIDAITNRGALTSPGNILPGSGFSANSIDCYSAVLGYAMGKLYLSYKENSAFAGAGVMFIYSETTGRWAYHRSAAQPENGFQCFFFDGVSMIALGGTADNQARTSFTTRAVWIDDVVAHYFTDEPAIPIQCTYQSHYENCGLPDNDKNWLEVVIDCDMANADGLSVYVGLEGGQIPLTLLGTIFHQGRTSNSFALGLNQESKLVWHNAANQATATDGVLAKSISVALDCSAATGRVIIHNVYLYYYVEARRATGASTIPLDLGSPKVKQCKELELDIDCVFGGATANVYADLPEHQLLIRQAVGVPANNGRAVWKFPLSSGGGNPLEGFLWRVAVTAADQPFRLYAARLLMRVIGIYVEAYESAAGFIWDSQEMTFDSGITHIPRGYAIALAALPIKRSREISLEIDTFGGDVLVDWWSDLPGNQQQSRFAQVINTGAAGRRFVRIPLPNGVTAPWIEGRMFRLRLSGTSKYVLYGASAEILAVGVYIEAYEAQAGAVYDSREVDFGSLKPKEARELELDIEITGNLLGATLYSDLPGYTMQVAFPQSANLTTAGRQKLRLPLTINADLSQYPMGRMFRLVLTSGSAYRLYGARLRVREFGTYLTGDEATGGAVWDSTPLDFDSERVKPYKKFEFDIQTDSPATLRIYTDQTGTIARQFQTVINTGGARETVTVTAPPGVRGRLLQVEIAGAGVRLFAGRVWTRLLNDAQADWSWQPLPIEPTTPQWNWLPFPVNETEKQWFYAKILSVEETSELWQWIEIDLSVSS